MKFINTLNQRKLVIHHNITHKNRKNKGKKPNYKEKWKTINLKE